MILILPIISMIMIIILTIYDNNNEARAGSSASAPCGACSARRGIQGGTWRRRRARPTGWCRPTYII